MQTGGVKMAKKIRRTIIILVLAFLLIYFLIMPIVNWNRTYDISDVTTPEKAIEYYFNAIKERNSKKAATIYPDAASNGIFQYVDIVYSKLYEVEEVPSNDKYNQLLKENEKLYYIDYKELTFTEWISAIDTVRNWTLKVAQNIETGTWYIADMYMSAC